MTTDPFTTAARAEAPPELCEVCGHVATDYKLDGLADPHYFCPAHASPPRSAIKIKFEEAP